MQSFSNTELIIYNTDVEYPIILSHNIPSKRIKVINNNTDYLTRKPYSNMGAIRRDSLSHASGQFYICWDDDDIFLPWNNQQCIDNILNSHFWAWKPYSSMAQIGNNPPHISCNVMEASIISRIDKIREFGFKDHLGGGEHLSWVKNFEDLKKIKVDKNSIPAYSFNWSDTPEVGGHKNSGTIKNKNNFNIHKKGCTDKHTRPIEIVDVSKEIEKYANLINENLGKEIKGQLICPKLFEKYAKPYSKMKESKSDIKNTNTKKRLVVVSMFRSGGTLIFNILKEIVAKNNLPYGIVKRHLDWSEEGHTFPYIKGGPQYQVTDSKAKWAKNNHFKWWNMKETYDPENDTLFYSYRNIEDVIISFKKRDKLRSTRKVGPKIFGKTTEDVEKWILEQDRIVRKHAKCFSYEKEIDNKELELQNKIETFLKVPLSKESNFLRRKMKKYTDSLKHHDPSTEFWPNHIS